MITVTLDRMLGTGVTVSSAIRHAPIAQVTDTQSEVFSNLFLVFVGLATIVGVVVISYTLYNALKYRTSEEDAQGRYDVDEESVIDGDDYDVVRPERGEIATGRGKGGGRKLFMSFGMSALIVLSLVIYSYTFLLYVEDTDANQEEALHVEVEGYQFGWDYEYDSGLTSDDYDASELNEDYDSNALVVPEGYVTQLEVTSRDVMHNYGIPEFKAKADAIPGDMTDTWFQPEKTGVFDANCYELCGAGHSNMKGDVVVLEPDQFEEWYLAQDGVTESDLDFMSGDGS
jgi:cytochrome c oxidase subunit 2